MNRWLGLMSFVFISSSTMAAENQILARELGERIQFSYSSTDGEFELECKHWIQNTSSGDFNVICGKGTKTVKEFSVHLVIREIPRKQATSFEVLYWVTDRNNQKPMPAFSSHTQLFTVDGSTQIREFVMSQGLENDGSFLRLRYAR